MLSPTLLTLLYLPTVALSQKYLFSFGSSYTDTSFKIDGQQPSRAFPLGNPDYGTGTTGGGPNYIDFLTKVYNSSLTFTYNFAVGGTVVSTSIVSGGSPDLQHQVSDVFSPKYSSPGAPAAAWSANSALFIIFMGDNDVQIGYTQNGGLPTTQLGNAYFEAVNNLYTAGARKFLFVRVPALDRSPAHKKDGAAANAALKSAIADYNNELVSRVFNFAAKKNDAKCRVYDFNAFMTSVLDNPTPYGFKDAECEGNGENSDCIWWQQSPGHTTSRFQKYMARDIAQTVLAGFW